VLDAPGICELDDFERFLKIRRDRLLAIDVLAGIDGLGQQARPRLRGRGIEEHGVVLISERRVEIGGPARDVVAPGERLDLLGAATDQDRIGHDAVAIFQANTALLADRDDRADQMLVEPHAAGDAVHDEAEALGGHCACSLRGAVFASLAVAGSSRN